MENKLFPGFRFQNLVEEGYFEELEQNDMLLPLPAKLNNGTFRSLAIGMVVVSYSELHPEGNNHGRTEEDKLNKAKYVFAISLSPSAIDAANFAMKTAFKAKFEGTTPPVFSNELIKVKTQVAFPCQAITELDITTFLESAICPNDFMNLDGAIVVVDFQYAPYNFVAKSGIQPGVSLNLISLQKIGQASTETIQRNPFLKKVDQVKPITFATSFLERKRKALEQGNSHPTKQLKH